MALSTPHLPFDVVVDILSKLPLKSLVRFRAVSKPWLHLITYSNFPSWLLHLHLSCDPLVGCPHNQSGLLLCYVSRDEADGSARCELFLLGGGMEDNAFRVASEFNFPLIRGKSFELKSACCHGMLCLTVQDDNSQSLVLWNPSIGDYKTLPFPDQISGFCDGVCGLGFDSSTDDYIVMSLWEKQFYAFSVKRNFWKNLGEFPYNLFSEGVPVNGCLYWAASKTEGFSETILRLNLSDYNLREVSLPPNDLSFIRPDWIHGEQEFTVMTEFNLLALGDSLCMYRQYDQSMWVMKEVKDENGVIRDTWQKMMNLPKISNRESHYLLYCRLQPKCFTKTGKLLVSVSRKWFVLFDGIRYEDLHVHGLEDNDRFYKAVVCTGSLVSPLAVRRMNGMD